ncbi:hypothetical protein K445DRAFT_197044 [Daldinia sp. EC12]|nr:hypothetical protein K445DRAFT_197044 [Daldinia sp. EC12]
MPSRHPLLFPSLRRASGGINRYLEGLTGIQMQLPQVSHMSPMRFGIDLVVKTGITCRSRQKLRRFQDSQLLILTTWAMPGMMCRIINFAHAVGIIVVPEKNARRRRRKDGSSSVRGESLYGI